MDNGFPPAEHLKSGIQVCVVDGLFQGEWIEVVTHIDNDWWECRTYSAGIYQEEPDEYGYFHRMSLRTQKDIDNGL